MRIALAFIKWIFGKVFEGLLDKHKMFRSSLRNETGLALFVWFATAAISTLLIMLSLAIFAVVTKATPPFEILVTWGIMWIIYLIYTGFSVMFKSFKEERAQLFETIKNGR